MMTANPLRDPRLEVQAGSLSEINSNITIVSQSIKRIGHLVSVNVQLETSANISDWTRLFVLPAGFIPADDIMTPVYCSSAGDYKASAMYLSASSGGVTTIPWTATGSTMQLCITYYTV